MSAAQLSNFVRELRYCYRAPVDIRSSILLLLQTIRFHFGNKLNLLGHKDTPFRIGLRVEPGYSANLYLRPIRGDLFILYEVLMGRCYFISPERLAPEKVKVIIDCGANIGITSLYFASRYPNATVISVEPHPENFELLKKNAEHESRIIPVHAAIVGTPQGPVSITLGKKAWGNTVTTDSGGFKVRSLTIDQLLETHRIDSVDLLKIDIEGSEADLFQSADFLSKVELGLIELHGAYDKEKFGSDIARHGHRLLHPGPENGIKMIGFERARPPQSNG